jgi:hypothetical protein
MSNPNPNALVKKWKDLLEAEGVPAIATASKKKIISRILEEQEKDLSNMGFLPKGDWQAIQEAEISGNASNATDIASGQNSGAIVYHGPTVMGIVRRAISQMMAFDTVGVQPLTQPTGQIFALRSVYGAKFGKGNSTTDVANNEAFKPGVEPRIAWSGTATAGDEIGTTHTAIVGAGEIKSFDNSDHAGVPGSSYAGIRYLKTTSTATTGSTTAYDDATKVLAGIAAGELVEVGEGIATGLAEIMEGFNGSSNNPFNEMSFRIDKQGVEAKSRQLKAQYSIELAQDLRAVHGLDADTELSNILANEIMVELNREIVVIMNVQAQTGKTGKTASSTTPDGIFDYNDPDDTKGARWAGEKYKAILIQIEKESNEIGRQTGRGNGNFILASRNVVSALAMTDAYVSLGQQGLQQGLQTDTNTSVFAGVLAGKYKVFIDQYAVDEYFLVGYKGPTEMDAGIFYSPYVPLTPLRGQDPKNMQPVLAYKTRYAVSINPFVEPENSQVFSNSLLRGVGANQYYRRVLVRGL